MRFCFKMNALIQIFCWIIILPSIKSDCVIKYTSNIDIAPHFERVLGKFKIKVPFVKSDTYNIIKLQEGETVHGYCKSYFSPIVYEAKERTESYDYYHRFDTTFKTVKKQFINQTNFEFTCRSASICYNTHKLYDQQLSCVEESWSIYSSKKPYGWCERNQKSSTFYYVRQMATDKNILATICYNMDQLSLQTLVYNTTSLKHNSYWNRPVDAANVNSSKYLDEDLWNFKSFIISELSETVLHEKLEEMAKTDDWLNLANYEVSLIAQNDKLMNYFKEYKNLLNIIWWRNLMVGNWKRFQNVLTNYAHNNSYEVYIGTSGVVQYPTDNKCNTERYLEIGYRNETVPAYIWTYLKSNDNLNKEFIIVGYNSPYAEYYTTEKVIFCPDICSEIPWLKTVSTTFRYAYAGIMFCCSPDFIRQTNYLQGFPIEILPKEQQIIIPVVTYTTEMGDSTTEYAADV